ncbi:MAG TPA: hypothetical protein VN616_16190 [Puia sp.]|nr:hypothetical protein [Puia sp.]
MNRTLLITSLCYILAVSCTTTSRVVKYPTVGNEIYANANLKQFLKDNKSPSIVLRVANTSDKATSQTTTNKDLLYNAIEKELLKEGFSVRDRGLFNEIINKAQTSDYSRIKDLTNTDLILEVVNIDPEVIYSTNKVTLITNGKEKEVLQNIDYKRYGASVEFKLILVRNNEIAGSYKYNYKPCPTGCELTTFQFTNRRATEVSLKESVQVNLLEDFMRSSTRDLIYSFREN